MIRSTPSKLQWDNCGWTQGCSMNISKSRNKYLIVSEIQNKNIIRWETFAQIISKHLTIKFQMKFVIWQWRMQVGSGCQIHFSEMKNLDLFTPFSSLTFTSEYSRMATYSTALGIFVWSPNMRLIFLDSLFQGCLINENLQNIFLKCKNLFNFKSWLYPSLTLCLSLFTKSEKKWQYFLKQLKY